MRNSLLLILMLLAPNLFAESNSPIELFKKGIASFKQKNYEESRDHLNEALNIKPNSISTLYNLGLSEYKLGKIGKASAYWKKTLALQPYHLQARNSINSIKNKIPSKGKNSSWDLFRENVLSYISLQNILILFTIFLTGCFATLIKHFTRRHIAIKNYLPLPKASNLTWVFSVLFILSSLLFFSKLYDHLSPRGVIIEDIAGIYLSPNEEDIKIRELLQGEEIIITKQTPTWLQIKTLSDNYGWVKRDFIFQTSGANIQ